MADAYASFQRLGPAGKEFTELCFAQGLQKLLQSGEITLTEDDVLVIVDLQNDFVPNDRLNPKGGRFGVHEGADTVPAIVQLMEHFLKAGARVVATRDYHPIDHVSFNTEKGHFPPHCIQGAIGSHFYSIIGDALERGLEKYGPEKVIVVFKGYHEDIDSFGSFEYPPGYEKERLCFREGAEGKRCPAAGGCLLDWTGSRQFKCSSLLFGDYNINAPPDILALEDSMSLADKVGHGKGRGFVTGLALDFCCLDTAVNAAAKGVFKETIFIWDACRAAYIPHVGAHGSGFLTDPAEVCKKLDAHKIRVIPTVAITKSRSLPELGAIASTGAFPDELGPFGLRPLSKNTIDYSQNGAAYTIQNRKPGSWFEGTYTGTCTTGAKGFCFPCADLAAVPAAKRLNYLGTQDPFCDFLCYGGFVTGSDAEVTLEAISSYVMQCNVWLHFLGVEKLDPVFAKALFNTGAFKNITIQALREKGYTKFTWLSPHEEIVDSDSKKTFQNWPMGAFVYMTGADIDSAIYFSVKSRELMEAE
eukprot:TRINITY_DN570_c0_g2_i1.p1 TRINITY_DN570_c0_g2~~TRINITY_DN570_c0_g2_i1.p1  ORF type:complete len:530 (+),score=142.32 TRINITY_DN570_c0_g2_i1:103-1692(+)